MSSTISRPCRASSPTSAARSRSCRASSPTRRSTRRSRSASPMQAPPSERRSPSFPPRRIAGSRPRSCARSLPVDDPRPSGDNRRLSAGTTRRPIVTAAYPTKSLEAHPPYFYPDYRSTVKRVPKRPLVVLPHTLSELTGPVYGHESVQEHDGDLTRQHQGEPLGERIIVTGRVLDEDVRPVPNSLVEIWQANASGRYVHVVDRHPAPLDPNFTGAGRAVTDAEGRYRFT